MAKFINTPIGVIQVETMPGVDSDDSYVVDCAKMNEFMPGTYPPGVVKHLLVKDENELMQKIKERFSEDSTSRGQVLPGFLGPRL